MWKLALDETALLAHWYSTILSFLFSCDAALPSGGQLHLFLMYPLQCLERFVDMSLRGELREEDATDNALSVDDVCHAPRQPESCGHAVALSDYFTHVAQQDVGELVLFGELPMRFHRIGADSYYFRSSVLEDFVAIPKGTRLLSADRSVIPWIEIQHNILLAEKIPKAYWCT